MDSSLLLIFISLISLLLGVKFWQTGNSLIENGKKAEAIIFKNNFKGAGYQRGLYFPVVRFLTEKKEWITQELSVGQNPPMEEGKRVTVIYDPEDPTTVDIHSTFRLEILPKILVVLGIFGIVSGFLVYLEIIELSSN